MRSCITVGLLCLYLLTALLPPADARSYPVRFYHYTTREGLSSNILYSLAQDGQGYIWMTTDAGVDRFDGHSFRHYEHRDGDPYTPPGNRVYVCSDREGNIWAFSGEGLARFDAHAGRFVRFVWDSTAESKGVRAIGFDRQHTMWFVTTDEWVRKKEAGSDRVQQVARLSDLVTNHILPDSKGRIWIAANEGLARLDAQTGEIQAYKGNAQTGFIENIFRLFEDNRQRLWLGTWGNGIGLFDPDRGSVTSFRFNDTGKNFPHNYVLSMTHPTSRPNDPEIWISNMDPELGIVVFNTETKEARTISHNSNDYYSLSNNAGICLLRDRNGNIWYAGESGLDKYSPAASRFPEINLDKIPGYEKDIGIWSLLADGPLLWIGTTGNGVYACDAATGRLRKKIDLSLFSISRSPESNAVRCISRQGHRLLFGCYQGAFVLDDRSGKPVEILPLQDRSVTGIARDKKGRYWFGTKDGLFVTDATLAACTDTFLYDIHINCVYADNEGTVWAGTSRKGLYGIKDGQVFMISGKDSAHRQLSGSTVNSITGDGKGNIYIAASNGVGIYNSGTLKFYTPEQGFVYNGFCHILPDKQGRIWLLHLRGISSLDPATGAFRHYGEREGVVGPTFDGGGLTMDEKGNVYFGRYISIYAFEPQALLQDTFSAPLYLTEVRYGDSLVPYPLQHRDQPLKISWKERSITFEYALLNYGEPEGNVYEYQLEGLDKTWIPAGDRRVVTYSNLRAGVYTFRVRARNSDGYYSGQEAQMMLTVVPPFWKTIWFRVLLGILIVSALLYIVRLRDRSIRTKERVKRQMIEAEMKALRAQMNPHFVFNSLNSINRYIVGSDIVTASGYLTRFSKLIRLILENSTADTILLDKEIQTLRLYTDMELLRFEDSFACDIEIHPPLAPEGVWIPSMVIQPFVENAIWHGLMHKEGGQGHLRISFLQLDRHTLQVIVEDNGIGRARARELKSRETVRHKSFGMRISNERLQLINDLHGRRSSVEIIDLERAGSPTGTRVILIIPIQKTGEENDKSGTD